MLGQPGQVRHLRDRGNRADQLGLGLRRKHRRGLRRRRGGTLGLEPGEVPADSLAKRGGGAPVELLGGSLVRDHRTAEVAVATGGVDDLGVVDQIRDDVRELADRHGLIAGQVVDAVLGPLLKAGDDALGEVLDVDEAPGLQAVSGDRQRLSLERLRDEDRDHGGGPGPRAVRNAEAQDRARHVVELGVGGAVHLAGELAGGVEVVGQAERGVLVDQAVAGGAVDPDRASVDDAGAGLAGGLEHGECAAGVALLRLDRLLGHDADVGVGGEVDDSLAVLHRGAERIVVEEIADHGVDRSRLVVRGGLQVIDPRLVAGVGELVDYVRADEAAAAGDQDSAHAVPSRACSPVPSASIAGA